MKTSPLHARLVSPAIALLLAGAAAACSRKAQPAPTPVLVTAEPAPDAPAAAAVASASASAAPRSEPAPRGEVTDLGCGADFACALTADGRVWCWGRNDAGQLGTGDRAYDVVRGRRPVEGLARASAVSLGNTHACALVEGGRVACWGYNGWGQLGDGAEVVGFESGGSVGGDNDRLRPVTVAGLPEPATAVAAGSLQACAILASKRVACWGANSDGQLGGPGPSRSVPAVVEGVAGVEELALGGDHTCARLTGGEVTCWGRGGRAPGLRPVEGLCAKQLTAGDRFTCALSCKDEVLCWGDTPHAARALPRPVRVPGLAAGMVEVRAGSGHVCARDGKGRLSCWGDNAFGQLGDENPKARPVPSAPSLRGAEARRVCAGGAVALVGERPDGEKLWGHMATTCALSPAGEVRCWGAATDTKTPTLVELPR
jgi:hypothetical protein